MQNSKFKMTRRVILSKAKDLRDPSVAALPQDDDRAVNLAFCLSSFAFARKRAGFGLIETIVGAAIISFVLLGLAQTGQFAFRAVDESNLKLRAAFFAEEGIEAVRFIRDSGWTANISPLALDTDYFLTFSNGTWQISATPVALLDNVFDRRLRFSAVYRDGNDAITATGGTLDSNIKKLTITVSWSNRGRTATTTISTYLTDLFDN